MNTNDKVREYLLSILYHLERTILYTEEPNWNSENTKKDDEARIVYRLQLAQSFVRALLEMNGNDPNEIIGTLRSAIKDAHFGRNVTEIETNLRIQARARNTAELLKRHPIVYVPEANDIQLSRPYTLTE